MHVATNGSFPSLLSVPESAQSRRSSGKTGSLDCSRSPHLRTITGSDDRNADEAAVAD